MCIHVFNPGFSEKQSELPSGMWGMATAVGTRGGGKEGFVLFSRPQRAGPVLSGPRIR